MTLNMVAESPGMIYGNLENDPNLLQLSHKSETPLGFS
jgi:hypothetical protein